MTIDLEVDGRRFRATVTERARGSHGADRITVTLAPLDGGETLEREIDVRATGAGYSLLHRPDGRVVDAAVTPAGPRDRWLVQLPGVDLDVAVNGRRHAAVAESVAAGGEQRVSAPMPGRVLRVLVAADMVVSAGQPLVVIEAMKMENALTAARDGVVLEVAVAEGVSVEVGRLLVRLA